MKYHIMIEGGFVNIAKSYEGEMALPEEEVHALFHLMAAKPVPPNPQLRDGHLYHIALTSQEDSFKATFDDSNLPTRLRELIRKAAEQESD